MDIKSKFSERPKITKKKSKNIYSVDSNYVNSIKFYQNVNNIQCSKNVKENIYNEAIKILEERDGTYYEKK